MRCLKTLFILFVVFQSSSFAFGFILHPLKKFMRIDNRQPYDREACITRPEKMLGHFVGPWVNPHEIQTFYINELHPRSKYGIGKDLHPITRRIVHVDVESHHQVDSFHVYLISACIPNEGTLEPSYETESADYLRRERQLFRK